MQPALAPPQPVPHPRSQPSSFSITFAHRRKRKRARDMRGRTQAATAGEIQRIGAATPGGRLPHTVPSGCGYCTFCNEYTADTPK